MPSVTLRKTDKLHALRGMIDAKFLDRYKKLMARRADLCQRVYDSTKGKIGYALKEAAGKDWQTWCETRDSLRLQGCEIPACIIDAGQRSTMYRSGMKDHFSGTDSRRIDRETIQLKCAVVWPERSFNHIVNVDEADKDTKKVAATLNRDIKKFNQEAQNFYDQAYGVLMQLRSTRRVDEMFPELWRYLPEGMRERIKQAVVVINQSDVDAVRKQLPGAGCRISSDAVARCGQIERGSPSLARAPHG